MDLQRGVTMVRLQLAEMHWSLFLVQSRFRWKPNLSFPKPRNGYLLRRLFHTKLEMRSGQLHSCHMERLVRAFKAEGPADQNKFGGAVAEQWKAVVGQRAQAPLSACAQAIAAAWTNTATTGRVPQDDKDAEIAFLPKPGKDIGDAKNWRTIALLRHIGKAWAKASVRPLVPAVAKVAVAILENVFERFTNSKHQASRRSCLLEGFLFDLETVFDTIPRNRLWAGVSDAAKLKTIVSGAGRRT